MNCIKLVSNQKVLKTESLIAEYGNVLAIKFSKEEDIKDLIALYSNKDNHDTIYEFEVYADVNGAETLQGVHRGYTKFLSATMDADGLTTVRLEQENELQMEVYALKKKNDELERQVANNFLLIAMNGGIQ